MVAFTTHVALFLLLLSACGPEADSPPPLPNVIIVFTDDQGWADIGAQGAVGFSTPNIDRLAKEGMRFTDFYVAQPVCSASRAALLTGCYPNRIGISGALGPTNKNGLNKDETTLAEICKSRGYATAIYGKWHLGHHPPFLPIHHGFDEWYGTPYSNDMWPLHPDLMKFDKATRDRKSVYPDLSVFENDQRAIPVVEPEHQRQFTSDFGQRAVDFIRKNQDQPFFLYLAHPMPHVPLYVLEDSEGRSAQGAYGDVIEEIDDTVGAILDTLEDCGIDEQTLVLFTSDNGPWLSYGNHGGSALPLREGKGTTFEGGVRVPCVARWPKTIPAGQICSEPMMTIDILPTIAGLIGAELPSQKIDGKDAWPLFLGEEGARSPQEAYFFYYHNNHLEAMRAGPGGNVDGASLDRVSGEAVDLERDGAGSGPWRTGCPCGCLGTGLREWGSGTPV